MSLNKQFINKNDLRQIALARESANYSVTIKTRIHLYIDSEKLADEVHNKIRELIREKNYPIFETDWSCLIGTNNWHFDFMY